MQTLLIIGTLGYAVTTCGYLGTLFRAQKIKSRGPYWCFVASSAYWAVAFPIGALSYQLCVGVRPWLLLTAWSLGMIFISLQRKFAIAAMGSFVAALSTILCIFALLVSSDQGRLVDGVMADFILWSHIGLAFLGLTIFSLAAAVSLLYLVVSHRLKTKKTTFLQAPMPSLETLDTLGHRLVLSGFPFYTLALLLGSAEAMRSGAPGLKLAYVLASISWLIYAIVLQARLTAGWRGQRAALLTLSGLVTAFTVVGLYSVGAG